MVCVPVKRCFTPARHKTHRDYYTDPFLPNGDMAGAHGWPAFPLTTTLRITHLFGRGYYRHKKDRSSEQCHQYTGWLKIYLHPYLTFLLQLIFTFGWWQWRRSRVSAPKNRKKRYVLSHFEDLEWTRNNHSSIEILDDPDQNGSSNNGNSWKIYTPPPPQSNMCTKSNVLILESGNTKVYQNQNRLL